MAQLRYHNYKQALISNHENHRLAGLIEPGRYRGFDNMNILTALTFELNHAATGIQKTLTDGSQTDMSGVLHMPNGTIIHEDAPIGPLPIADNSGSSEKRVDLVICEHEYLSSVGGQSAVYSVVQGPANDPSVPALPNPAIQVIVGTIEIPAGSSDLNDATYTPSRAKGLGNEEYAFLNKPNHFGAYQSFGAPGDMVVPQQGLGNDPAKFYLDIPETGNVFYVDITTPPAQIDYIRARPAGTPIYLFFIGQVFTPGVHTVLRNAQPNTTDRENGWANFNYWAAWGNASGYPVRSVGVVTGHFVKPTVGANITMLIHADPALNQYIVEELNKKLASANQVDWTDITTFQNGAANVAGAPLSQPKVGYMINSQGRLFMRGAFNIASGLTGSPKTLFTLPVGARPGSTRVFPLAAYRVSGATPMNPPVLIFKATGDVDWGNLDDDNDFTNDVLPSGVNFSVDGINFEI